MIVVTLELWPGGRIDQAHTLGVAVLANTGEGTPTIGDYRFTLSKWAPLTHEPWKDITVKGFPRLRLGAWDLLYRCLREAVGERNKGES